MKIVVEKLQNGGLIEVYDGDQVISKHAFTGKHTLYPILSSILFNTEVKKIGRPSKKVSAPKEKKKVKKKRL